MTTVSGRDGAGFGGDGGPAISGFLSRPNGIAVDAAGNLFIADTDNARVRKIDSAGIISTVAGNGLASFSGDGGPATFAQFGNPNGVAVDRDGNLFIADTYNQRVRKVTLSGVISTIAGIGTQSFSGDGGPAISASLSGPNGVAVDMAGNLLIADSWNDRVRRVTSAGIISTVAGGGLSGFGMDGVPATSTQLDFPASVAVDTAGSLLIAEYNYGRIRRVDLSGIISTLAGMGSNQGFGGDYGPAISAGMIGPLDVSTDQSGNLFIADSQSNRVRKITPSGIISTVAGAGNPVFTGNPAFSGDGGPATEALLSDPHGVTVDRDGNLFIADTRNHRIRKVTPSGIISTVAGTGDAGYSGDGGSAAAAQLNFPTDIVVDSKNNLFVADTLNNRIRKLTPITESRAFSISDRGGVSLTTSGTEAAAMTGYATMQPNSGLTTPSGVAIVGFRQNNVLVSEASTPSSSLIRAGRIYAEIDGPVNTGLAIANPNDQPATVSFYFTDSRGDFGSGITVIPAKGQIAKFLNEAPFNGRSPLSGTFTFSSSVPLAVIALRGLTNERSEFLITTLPVADLSANAVSSIFPHFADGGGWTTQIVLVNTGDTTATGTVQFLSPSGQAAVVGIGGLSNSSFNYSIAPRSAQKLQTSGAGAAAQAGSVRILPVAGTSPLSGLAIFSFRNSGVTVTEAGVPAVPTGNAFRVYAETAPGNPDAVGSIQTGIAVANATTSAAAVVVELTRLDGSSIGLTGTLSVPAAGQVATFLKEIPGFASLPASFQGVLRVSSTQPISVVGLRGRYNERNDFLITTTPPINEATPATTERLFFPQIVDGGGYMTQFILISGQPGQSSSGTMQWFSQSGEALGLALQ
jgi:sugar lactone lactonase YvrE